MAKSLTGENAAPADDREINIILAEKYAMHVFRFR